MIHATAIVSEKATVAGDVEIGPYSIIGDDVEIGSGTRIDSHVVIKGPTTIGRDNRIYQFAALGDDPQDKAYGGEPTRLVVGDRNTIREYVTFSRGTAKDRGVTTVGDDNWIMAHSHVAHDCVVGDNVVMANNTALAGHVYIGDWVICGGNSGVHQFCKIGAHAFLGMFSAVNRDIPAYSMVSGQPAVLRGINSEGLRRRGFAAEQIRNIKRAYRIAFRSGRKLADALEEIEALAAGQPELDPFLDSLRSSERGLAR
ncbi:MAG: acyl-ACP--UDP-N-acetylglucosamine O-acyltransferase [Proteobacteria bacterium]|nr:acyl-ACP--UDP-N-acetylglucosamine O-acyltransferase [Pseudomonadota bacterium]